MEDNQLSDLSFHRMMVALLELSCIVSHWAVSVPALLYIKLVAKSLHTTVFFIGFTKGNRYIIYWHVI